MVKHNPHADQPAEYLEDPLARKTHPFRDLEMKYVCSTRKPERKDFDKSSGNVER
ncbi:hypothetical protein D3C87_2089300 [compost metagenome]